MLGFRTVITYSEQILSVNRSFSDIKINFVDEVIGVSHNSLINLHNGRLYLRHPNVFLAARISTTRSAFRELRAL